MSNFLTTLTQIRKGSLVAALTDELNEVSEAVTDTGKAGTLTLTLTIKPNGDDCVIIQPKIAAKAPKQSIADAIFFIGKEGLQRQDPSQTDVEDDLAARRAKIEGEG